MPFAEDKRGRALGGRLGLLELTRDAIERAHDLPDGIGGDACIERRGVTELGSRHDDSPLSLHLRIIKI
jgi:hypothetical protein